MIKLMLIGQIDDENLNGPEAIVNALDQEYRKTDNIEYYSYVNNGNNNTKYIFELITFIFKNKNLVINVHSSGLGIPLIILFLSKIAPWNKYYLTLHGLYAIESEMKGVFNSKYAIMEKIIISHFPNITVVSDMMKDNINAIFLRNKNVFVVPNGCDTFGIKNVINDYNGKLNFVTIGGLRNRKGIIETLTIISDLQNKYGYDIELQIYGREEGQYTKDWLKHEIIEYNLSPLKVKYCGLISDKRELYNILANCHFHIAFSKYDTFNVAIIEALSIGCPTIASNMCGASYLIKNITDGLVVDLKEPNYSEIINEYITEYKATNKYNKIDHSKEFLWSNIVALYLKVFSQ